MGAVGEDVPPMQLKEGVFRCIMQLYDCLLTEVHERCKKGSSLAKRLNSSLAFFCYDLLSIIEPRQVFELVCFLFVNYTVQIYFVMKGFLLNSSSEKNFLREDESSCLFVNPKWRKSKQIGNWNKACTVLLSCNTKLYFWMNHK